jgi:rubrerythrin
MAIDGCLTCPDSSLRFNGGNGATTCGKLNDLIVNIGTTKPEARPAKCPLPPLTGQEVSELIADRNEARSEVRALREQRDAIREKHRVELAALTAKLAALESVHQSACRKLHKQVAGWKVTEGERDALKAKLAALVAAVPAGRTVLCVEVTDACTSCGELVPESPAEDRCPSCGAEWCMTTYVGDPNYCITHTELGNPPSLDEALRAARAVAKEIAK